MAAGSLTAYKFLIKTPDTSCTLVFSMGDVTVKSGNKIFSPDKGYIFHENDLICTKELSTAYIDAGNGTTIRISQLTLFSIGTIRDSENASVREYIMDKGRIAAVSKKLKKGDNISVKTPTAVVAVRGTVFTVAFDGIESRISVNNGKVEVNSSDGAVQNFLSDGQSVRTEDNALLADHITDEENSDMKECQDVSDAAEKDDEIDSVIRRHREKIEHDEENEKQEDHSDKIKDKGDCVGIMPFYGENISRHMLKELTDDVARGIERKLGDDHAVNIRKHADRIKDANKILSGTIEKSGDGFTITARMVDTGTSVLLYEFSGTAASKHEISDIAKIIAKEATSKLRVKESE
ncbi:MAG: FecR domain-containing protein [Spirochaetota bacterium]